MAFSLSNALDYKGGLNGLKLVLGAALIVLAQQLDALNQLITYAPQYSETLQHIAAQVQSLIDVVQVVLTGLERVLQVVAVPLMGIGFLDKAKKLFGA